MFPIYECVSVKGRVFCSLPCVSLPSNTGWGPPDLSERDLTPCIGDMWVAAASILGSRASTWSSNTRSVGRILLGRPTTPVGGAIRPHHAVVTPEVEAIGVSDVKATIACDSHGAVDHAARQGSGLAKHLHTIHLSLQTARNEGRMNIVKIGRDLTQPICPRNRCRSNATRSFASSWELSMIRV